MLAWLTAVVKGVLDSLFGWLQARQHDADERKLGETHAKLETAIAGQAEVAEAVSAGQAMSDSLARDPDSLRAPDKYSRPE